MYVWAEYYVQATVPVLQGLQFLERELVQRAVERLQGFCFCSVLGGLYLVNTNRADELVSRLPASALPGPRRNPQNPTFVFIWCNWIIENLIEFNRNESTLDLVIQNQVKSDQEIRLLSLRVFSALAPRQQYFNRKLKLFWSLKDADVYQASNHQMRPCCIVGNAVWLMELEPHIPGFLCLCYIVSPLFS